MVKIVKKAKRMGESDLGIDEFGNLRYFSFTCFIYFFIVSTSVGLDCQSNSAVPIEFFFCLCLNLG